ncbi:Outer membrane protein transport protein (OMPP1/FadL/TodX) [Belliella buryatensis]|uniref:Outer membrane protein transport protein (OMPP1/FadL/TodX) n=1 Tax=Belliella buryatensis TaxID=1500549 RepID=A0A239G1A6_9BACT|nr:outer membrane protein transport protein [Belliella buryatensis]SNS62951.1 Outer membrane protein transport protein (OMPP1/FadL/TodX) [Belliella buryatensis]
MTFLKKLLIGGAVVSAFSLNHVNAQTSFLDDAQLFSQFRSTGSARINALGGAQMSLGGDISNIHSNAAGLGFFRRSEFSITPSFAVNNAQTNFLGQLQDDRTPNFSLPNLSLVIAKPKGELQPGSFRGGTFGVSFNRIADFNNQFGYFSDIRNQNSLLDFYINQYTAFGEPPIGASDGLVLDIELVQGNPGTGYFKDPEYVFGQPFADETIITEGGITQTSFSYGANFENKLFIGGGLGIHSVNFFQNRVYGEEFLDGNNVRSLIYSIEDNTRINGFGASINLGVIYKPIETVNLGLNFKSPTWYRLNKEVDANIIGEFFNENGQLTFTEREFSNVEINTTTLSTPLLLSAGGTFFVGKSGFITADIDYVDYSQNRINSRDFDTSFDNRDLATFLGSTFNYRVGGEYRFDIWRLRAGYAYYGDPTTDTSFDRSMQRITGGVGVRLSRMYIDFALINSQSDNLYNSYAIINSANQNVGPFSEIRNNMTQGMVTVGFNF